MVNQFLKEDPDQRIPLIQVFKHPWVMYFQNKFFANWQPEEGSDEEADETSSEEEEEEDDDEEDAYDDEDEDECSDDETDQMQSSKTPPGGQKAAPADSNFRQAHADAFVAPKQGTAGYSVPNDFEDDSEGE